MYNIKYYLGFCLSLLINFCIAQTDYVQIITYGQSLSLGWEAPEAITTDALDGNFMVGSNVSTLYNDGSTNLQPLVAARWSKGGEQPIVSCVNAFSKAYKNNINANQKFLAFSAGEGGQTIERLSKECTNDGFYESTFIEGLNHTLDAIGSQTVSCPAIIYMQGEHSSISWRTAGKGLNPGTNGTTDKTVYKDLLLVLKNNMQADIMDKYDQNEKPLFFIYQTSGGYIAYKENPITMAQIEFSEENDDVVLLSPHYGLPDYGGGHLSTNGYRWYGEIMAKSLINELVYKIPAKTLTPLNFEVNLRTITIDYDVPVSPLVFDTWTNPMQTNYGFEVYQDNSIVTINSVQIINSDQVEINCESDLTGNIEIVYAGNTTNGSGNLRDSDESVISMYTYFENSEDSKLPDHIPTNQNGSNLYGQKYGLQNWSDAFYFDLNEFEPPCIKMTSLIEAECFDDMEGINTANSEEGTDMVSWVENEDWTAYNNIELGTINTFNARIASKSSGTIEVRLDSLDGELLTNLPITYTGDWKSWTTESISFNPVGGTHDIYLKFKGGDGYLVNLNWVGFTEEVVPIDCNGDVIGIARLDACGICSGGNTGIEVDACLGCGDPWATSFDGENIASNVLDNDFDTRWSGKGVGEYIEVCVGEAPISVESIEVSFFVGDTRTTTFDVKLSLDGLNWITVLEDVVSSGNTLEKEEFTFPESQAWKIRLVGKGNSSNDWNSITELSWNEVITSTQNYEIGTSIDVFPNPSSGSMTINSKTMISQVNMLNVIGHQVMDIPTNESTVIKLDVSSLSKGVYLIEVILEDGSSIIRKFIKE